MAANRQECKVFVGGLSWETDDRRLANYFANYGAVNEAFVSYDRNTGRPRGFGFVVFDDPAVADKVVAVQHTIDRREVEAKKAVPKSEEQPAAGARGQGAPGAQRTKKVFVGGLAPSVDEAAFRQHFEQFGEVEDAVVMYDHDNKRPRGFGFVTFFAEEAVDAVFAAGSMQTLHEKPIEIKRAVPRDQLPPARAPVALPGARPGAFGAAQPRSFPSARPAAYLHSSLGLAGRGYSGLVSPPSAASASSWASRLALQSLAGGGSSPGALVGLAAAHGLPPGAPGQGDFLGSLDSHTSSHTLTSPLDSGLLAESPYAHLAGGLGAPLQPPPQQPPPPLPPAQQQPRAASFDLSALQGSLPLSLDASLQGAYAGQLAGQLAAQKRQEEQQAALTASLLAQSGALDAGKTWTPLGGPGPHTGSPPGGLDALPSSLDSAPSSLDCLSASLEQRLSGRGLGGPFGSLATEPVAISAQQW